MNVCAIGNGNNNDYYPTTININQNRNKSREHDMTNIFRKHLFKHFIQNNDHHHFQREMMNCVCLCAWWIQYHTVAYILVQKNVSHTWVCSHGIPFNCKRDWLELERTNGQERKRKLPMLSGMRQLIEFCVYMRRVFYTMVCFFFFFFLHWFHFDSVYVSAFTTSSI